MLEETTLVRRGFDLSSGFIQIARNSSRCLRCYTSGSKGAELPSTSQMCFQRYTSGPSRLILASLLRPRNLATSRDKEVSFCNTNFGLDKPSNRGLPTTKCHASHGHLKVIKRLLEKSKTQRGTPCRLQRMPTLSVASEPPAAAVAASKRSLKSNAILATGLQARMIGSTMPDSTSRLFWPRIWPLQPSLALAACPALR